MNDTCNNTHLAWTKSPMGIEFKRIGHPSFVPFISLGGVETQQYQSNPIPAGFEYPTEEEDIDMAPAELKQNPRQGMGGYQSKNKKLVYDDRHKSELLQDNTTPLPRIDLPRAYAMHFSDAS